MRKIVVGVHAGFSGTDAYEFLLVPENVSEEELNEYCWEQALQHAESYGVYYLSDYEDEFSEEELDSESYSESMEGWYELYDPEKHDGLAIGNEIVWQKF